MPPDSPRDKLAGALGADADHVVMERGYSLGFVGVNGQVRLVQWRASKKGFSRDRAADDAVFAGFLDDFCAVVERLLRERWGAIALRVAFDGEGEVIARLFEQGSLARCDAVDPAGTSGVLVEPGEQVDARVLLVRASARPVENWGVFEIGRPLDDGGFAHEQRCRLLVSGARPGA
jgi:hypothetical protein